MQHASAALESRVALRGSALRRRAPQGDGKRGTVGGRMTSAAGNNSLKHIRVDQVGSLVPDQGWRDAVAQYKRGEANAKELRTAQDAAIAAAIARQEAIGLPVVTDGELRRLNFQESFAASVSGFDVPTQARTDYQPSAE